MDCTKAYEKAIGYLILEDECTNSPHGIEQKIMHVCDALKQTLILMIRKWIVEKNYLKLNNVARNQVPIVVLGFLLLKIERGNACGRKGSIRHLQSDRQFHSQRAD